MINTVLTMTLRYVFYDHSDYQYYRVVKHRVCLGKNGVIRFA